MTLKIEDERGLSYTFLPRYVWEHIHLLQLVPSPHERWRNLRPGPCHSIVTIDQPYILRVHRAMTPTSPHCSQSSKIAFFLVIHWHNIQSRDAENVVHAASDESPSGRTNPYDDRWWVWEQLLYEICHFSLALSLLNGLHSR